VVTLTPPVSRVLHNGRAGASVFELFTTLSSSPRGLTEDEATQRLLAFGENRLPADRLASASDRLRRPLPSASVGGLAGLVEIVYANGGQSGLADLAEELNFEIDDLLPLVDAAAMLGLVTIDDGELNLTDIGAQFTTADIQVSKHIFAAQARSRAPLVRTICNALSGSASGNLRAGFFLGLLRRGFSVDEARRQLDIAIDWGRYGELYDFDSVSDEITADPAVGIHDGMSSTTGAIG
jgi:hypothetical protein